jgi:hypothetical protein
MLNIGKLSPKCIKELDLLNQGELAYYLRMTLRTIQRYVGNKPNFCYPINIYKRKYYYKPLVDLYVKRYPYKIEVIKENKRQENLTKVAHAIEDYYHKIERENYV